MRLVTSATSSVQHGGSFNSDL